MSSNSLSGYVYVRYVKINKNMTYNNYVVLQINQYFKEVLQLEKDTKSWTNSNANITPLRKYGMCFHRK